MIDISILELTKELARILGEFALLLAVMIGFAIVFRLLYEIAKGVFPPMKRDGEDLDDPIDEYRQAKEQSETTEEDISNRLKKEWK